MRPFSSPFARRIVCAVLVAALFGLSGWWLRQSLLHAYADAGYQTRMTALAVERHISGLLRPVVLLPGFSSDGPVSSTMAEAARAWDEANAGFRILPPEQHLPRDRFLARDELPLAAAGPMMLDGRPGMVLTRAPFDPAAPQVALALDDDDMMAAAIQIGEHGLVSLWIGAERLALRGTDRGIIAAIPLPPALTAILSGGRDDTSRIVSVVDHQERIVSLRQSPVAPFAVTVGRALVDIQASWRGSAIVLGGLTLALAVCLVLMFEIQIRQSQRLSQERERFEDYAESASDWLWEQDENLQFTFLSGGLVQLSGLSPSQFLGRTRNDVTADSLPPAVRAAHQEDLRARRAFRDLTYSLEDAAGRRRIVRISGQPIFDAAGRFRGYRGTGRDVTDLIEAETLLREAIEAIDDAIALFDSDDRLRLCNRRWLQGYTTLDGVDLHGATFEMLLRRTLPDRLSVKASPGEIEAYVAWRLERHRAADGQPFEQVVPGGRVYRVTEYRTADGGVVSVRTDISGLRQAQVQLEAARDAAEAASRAKSTFLAQMSHELRTPLNAIIGYSELLEHGAFGPIGSPKNLEAVRDIRMSGQHLLGTIQGILDLSLIEAGRREIEQETLDMAEVLETSRTMVDADARAGGVVLQVTLPDDAPLVMADHRALVQIVANLLSNAIKFSPQGGTVQLAAALGPDGGWRLRVLDHGDGIAPAVLSRIFEPMSLGQAHVARRFQGAGLGLAIAKRLVELHGGRIDIESQPGEGTAVTVDLPPVRTIAARTRRSAVRG